MTTMKLRHVASIRLSNVDKKSIPGELPVRLCNYTDVYNNPRIRDDLEFMEATATREQAERFALRRGDVIITKDSETPDDIAVAALVDEDIPNLVCGYHLALLRPARLVDSKYLYWALVSTSCRQQASAAATGITRFGLSQDDIAAIQLPVPSIHDQQAIAAQLDRETAQIDKLIAAKRQLMDLAERRLARYAQVLTVGGRPTISTGMPWMPAMSNDRSLVRLGELAQTGSGTTPPSDDERFYGGGIPWVCTGDLTDGSVEHTGRTVDPLALRTFPTLRLYESGAIVMAMYGATIGKLGRVTRPSCTNQACCVIYKTDRRLDMRYLWVWLLAFREGIIELGQGGGQPNISQELIRDLRLPLPTVTEQERVAHAFEKASSRVSGMRRTISAQIKLLIERRQALVTDLVSTRMTAIQSALT